MKMSPDYIVGLVDGEGSFTVYVRSPHDSSERIRRVRAEPKFYVKLVEKDKKILYALKTFFGCGQVYFQKDARKNHQNCYRYEVSNREDLERVIIPFFRMHALRFPSKANDFTLFCHLMEMIKRNMHLKKDGLTKMYRLKQKMH